MWAFLGLVLCASQTNYFEDGLACVPGTWEIKDSECSWFFNGKQITLAIRRYSHATFFVDVNPTRWSRKRLYYLELDEAESGAFAILNNRRVPVTNGTFVFGPRCSIDIQNLNLNGVEITGESRAGAGSLSVVNSNNDTCPLLLAKRVKYESWRFSLSVFLGILAMFLGFAGYFGWSKEDLTIAPSLPIDNPGEEYDPVEANPHREEEDEFCSDDGY